MSLTVIGAGLGRTGTLSLRRALEELGFAPCYHSLDSTVPESERIHSALNRDPPDWHEAFGAYRAAVDWPANVSYLELAQTYPSSKIILTIRDPDDYRRSYKAISAAMERYPPGPEEAEFARRLALRHTVSPTPPDRDPVLARFHQHNAEVQKTIPPERLLVFDVRQGWKPLCEFLDVCVPDVVFPRVNSTAELPLLTQRLWQENQETTNQ